MNGQDTYSEPKVITYGNITIRVHRPDLTDEERQRREAHVLAAMQQIGIAMQEGDR